ncbi:pentatricopeptide repeat (PPR) superfamily protein [Striga asiatica]|uniref:Pentatricopeptide repeat (PPR) superfamily protein n=1 Tax=Striga asiatica TaxID=4170 RepID=A0A5A7R149_STRAF|nr:pentatricopeptide repeat (PPR) superfamily protein [Striga asiatica]
MSATRTNYPSTCRGACPDELTIAFCSIRDEYCGTSITRFSSKEVLHAVVDYFSKWIEAEAMAKITEEKVIKQAYFGKGGVISFKWGCSGTHVYRGNTPEIADSKMVMNWSKPLICSGPCRAAWDDLMRLVPNKVLSMRFKTCSTRKGHNRQVRRADIQPNDPWARDQAVLFFDGTSLDTMLYVYRNTPRASTGNTLFSLVYGIETIIPVEISLSSQ